MKALVIGAARSGVAVSKLLNDFGYEVYLTDAKEIKCKKELQDLGINVYDLGHPELLYEQKYDLVVKNPGIKYTVPIVKHFSDLGYFIYNETEVAYQLVGKNYLYASITGTNGKTTTTSILEHILKIEDEHNSSAGNIGLPLSEVCLAKRDNLKVAIEISAFQLLGIKEYRPIVSTITNLAKDHLDYFKDADEYYRTKCLVYANQKDDDWFIRNLDDETVMKYCHDIPCKVIDFSLKQKKDLYYENEAIYLFGEKLFDRKDLHLIGDHNVANAAMAACMAYKMGVSIENIQKGIKTFKAVEHRIEYVDEINGISFYNDSKATTVESTVVALKSFEKPVILLAGGYDKKTGFDVLKTEFDKIKYLIAFGDCKNQIKDLYKDAYVVEDMQSAFNLSLKLAEKSDIVLLSPMCASYDQFDNYEQRGRIFKDYVRRLKGNEQ